MGTTTCWCGATTTGILVTTLDTYGTWNGMIDITGGNRHKDKGSYVGIVLVHSWIYVMIE